MISWWHWWEVLEQFVRKCWVFGLLCSCIERSLSELGIIFIDFLKLWKVGLIINQVHLHKIEQTPINLFSGWSYRTCKGYPCRTIFIENIPKWDKAHFKSSTHWSGRRRAYYRGEKSLIKILLITALGSLSLLWYNWSSEN